MAKLSAYGRKEIGTIYSTTSAKRYMTDGSVLRNNGFGWKKHATVKDGIDPHQAFANAQARQAEFLAQRPAYAAYRKALHDLAGLSKRWKLHAAIELMPDDCDGVWSETCDGYGDNIHADVDDIGRVCRLYKNAVEESREHKANKVAA